MIVEIAQENSHREGMILIIQTRWLIQHLVPKKLNFTLSLEYKYFIVPVQYNQEKDNMRPETV